jgi:D-xylose 1-dehydrogenase (NADP+, D-xylono-1,5-lactone-forming)
VMTAGGVDSRFVATMRMPGDVIGEFNCGFDMAARDELEIVGSEGTLFADDPWHSREPVIEFGDERIEVEQANAYRLELEDVSAAIRGERPARLGREDAVGQARALQMLRESCSA